MDANHGPVSKLSADACNKRLEQGKRRLVNGHELQARSTTGPLQRERPVMMFVCYSLTLGILGFAYHAPDLALLIGLLFLAKYMLK